MATHALRIAASLILISAAAHGQSATPVAMALHDATPIRLRLTRDLTFNNVKPGEMVDFEMLDDLRIDGVLVIAHGLRVSSTITQAEPKTRMGRGGKLGVKLEFIPLLNGDKVAIRPVKEEQSSERTEVTAAATAAPSIVKPPAARLLFSFGKDELFQEGARITVYIDGETKLDPARFLVDMAFTSNPAGALVTIYGMPVGRTPFTTRLATGAYKAVFSREGYSDLTQNVPVGPGYSNAVHAAFESKP